MPLISLSSSITQIFSIKNFTFSIFLSFLILNLGTSAISNFTIKYFILKTVVSVLLIGSVFLFLYHSKISPGNFFRLPNIKNILIVLTLIIVYPAVTLLYSGNPGYGGLKILNFFICSVPIVLGAYFLIKIEWDNRFFITALTVTSAIIIVSLAAVLIVKPFEPGIVYEYEPGRWSYVFIGRIISFLTLFLFFVLLKSKGKVVLLIALIVTAGTFLLYLTGLRSAIIGFVLAALVSIIYFGVTRRITNTHYAAILFIIIINALLIYSSDYLNLTTKFKTPERFEQLFSFNNIYYGSDGALIARVQNYNLAWEMFNSSPLIGNGYGSFNGYNNIEWTASQKYPHNIILEILSELGIAGLLFFGYIFFLIFRSIFTIHRSSIINHTSSINNYTSSIVNHPSSILTLLLFSFWLAMFSKDLSSQSFLWMFIVAIGTQENVKSES